MTADEAARIVDLFNRHVTPELDDWSGVDEALQYFAEDLNTSFPNLHFTWTSWHALTSFEKEESSQ